jgi:hypothetical protein
VLHSLLLQSGVVVPSYVVALITSLVAAGVALGIKEILAGTGVNLSDFATGLTAVVAGIIIAFLNGLLGQIPVNFAPFASEILNLLVLLLGAVFGPLSLMHVYKSVRRNGPNK